RSPSEWPSITIGRNQIARSLILEGPGFCAHRSNDEGKEDSARYFIEACTDHTIGRSRKQLDVVGMSPDFVVGPSMPKIEPLFTFLVHRGVENGKPCMRHRDGAINFCFLVQCRFVWRRKYTIRIMHCRLAWITSYPTRGSSVRCKKTQTYTPLQSMDR